MNALRYRPIRRKHSLKGRFLPFVRSFTKILRMSGNESDILFARLLL
jgi:hypothetical protein